MKNDNELIAEFMGMHKADSDKLLLTPEFVMIDKDKNYWSLNKLEYATSWDWLMPVVEKISKFVYDEYKTNNGYKDVIEKDYAYPRTFAMLNSEKFMVRFNRMTLHESESLIDATYQAIVEFVKWYNENKSVNH